MRIFYLPASTLDLQPAALREGMRKHHWRRYFDLCRDDGERAQYHRKLAESLQGPRLEKTVGFFASPSIYSSQ
mgnify:FL=1